MSEINEIVIPGWGTLGPAETHKEVIKHLTTALQRAQEGNHGAAMYHSEKAHMFSSAMHAHHQANQGGHQEESVQEGHGAFADWARENKAAKHQASLERKAQYGVKQRGFAKAEREKRDHLLAHHIMHQVSAHTPDVDPFMKIASHAIHHLGYPREEVAKHMDRVTRKYLKHKDYNDYVMKTAEYAHKMNPQMDEEVDDRTKDKFKRALRRQQKKRHDKAE